ncbi:DUF374 domain-containing protein [bacterium]|nr:DUF374 domain-containing protein [bacterium]
MGKKKNRRWRATKFWLLQHVVLPIAVLPVKAWMWTWRIEWETPDFIEEIRPKHPSRVIAVLHGHQLQFLGTHLKMGKRRIPSATMVSPSRDGQLLGDVISRFGATTVSGSSKSRGAAGLIELIKVVREGLVGLIAVDGPRGPRAVPRPGILTLAKQSEARLYTVVMLSAPAVRFKSWDRTELPMPFAKVRARAKLFHDYSAGEEPPNALWALQNQILEELEKSGEETQDIKRLEKESC